MRLYIENLQQKEYREKAMYKLIYMESRTPRVEVSFVQWQSHPDGPELQVLEDSQTSTSNCGEQGIEDNRIARLPDIAEHSSDDGGASSRGDLIREIRQVLKFSERGQVGSNVPTNTIE